MMQIKKEKGSNTGQVGKLLYKEFFKNLFSHTCSIRFIFKNLRYVYKIDIKRDDYKSFLFFSWMDEICRNTSFFRKNI